MDRKTQFFDSKNPGFLITFKNLLPPCRGMAKEETVDIREKLDEGWIHGRVIIEMLGAPQDYVEKTLHLYVEKIKKEKEYLVLKEAFEKPEKRDDLFAVFVELEMLAKDASALVFFCFDYMPSSIEIIAPQQFTYRAADFTDFFNDLQARLHKMDMITKNMRAENRMLQINASRLLRNMIIVSLREKDKDLSLLAKNIGIPEKQLKPILENLVKDKHIKKKGKLYGVAS